jgi:hypothetical protein
MTQKLFYLKTMALGMRAEHNQPLVAGEFAEHKMGKSVGEKSLATEHIDGAAAEVGEVFDGGGGSLGNGL